MSNIHAPTVPSGPTTVPVANGNASHLTFSELERRKQNVEDEMKALGGVLDSHGVDMNTSLLTPDGFPRSDIDVAQIRTTRARIICLRNDYKELMALIETRLHEHFANLPDDEPDAAPTPATREAHLSALRDTGEPEVLDVPFAKVNSVIDNSPAAAAGLERGDVIRNFGYVNAANNDNLKKVAECVQGNEGRDVLVKVSRNGRELQLILRPSREWGGRGLLGCHILPL